MTLFIPWVPPREVQVDHLAPELTLAGGRTAPRPARWKSTRISLKTEWGTGGLLTKELEVLSGLLHPNILLLMATTSRPNNTLQLIFEQVAHGSLYQCLHQRPIVPNLALPLNRVDVLLQVKSALIVIQTIVIIGTLYLNPRGTSFSVSCHCPENFSLSIRQRGQQLRGVEEQCLCQVIMNL